MSSITTGGKTTTYAYDADGIRTTKVVGGVTHEYLTLNGKVVYEKIGTGGTAKVMVFTYDAQGRPFAVKYSKNNGESFTNYFYALNLQGDVVKIFRPVSVKDAGGNITGYTEKTYATYSYNAWGELTGITDSNGNSILNKQTTSNALANLNPLRYRGYYYDNETGFYYLQSRYYDPANRRFINADAFTSTDSTDAIACNMFAYCGNNPVTRSDETGDFWNFVVGAIVGAVVNAVTTAVEAVKEGGWDALTEGKTWAKIGVSAAAGAIGGAISASGCCAVGQAIATGVLNATSNISNSLIDGEEISWGSVAADAAIGVGSSFFGSALTRKASGAAKNTINKGIDKVVIAIDKYDSGSRYWKGAAKKGLRIIESGVRQLNTVQGKASVLGSAAGGTLTIGKNLLTN